MSFLIERLAELRQYLDHLQKLRPRVTDRATLATDLSLQNDVLFSLLMVAQIVIDIAGEVSARRGERFEDYTGAVRNLARDPRFPAALVTRLERLPGLRNIIVHRYVDLDLDRVIAAFDLEPIEQFLQVARYLVEPEHDD